MNKCVNKWVIGVVLAAGLGFSSPINAGVEGEFETGVAFISYNNVRIPGDDGTHFSLVRDLSTNPAPFFRVRLGYRIAQRHLITALAAPLQVNSRGRLDKDLTFHKGVFPANTPLLAVYRFDSYRLTYRYSFFRRDNLDVAAGLTGKIRSAEISVYGADAQRRTDVGFVPLINLHLAWRPQSGPVGMLLDIDALAAPQGRAEDILLAATWRVQRGIELRAGYRMVEGGADNRRVYNFTWIHYATVGVRLLF